MKLPESLPGVFHSQERQNMIVSSSYMSKVLRAIKEHLSHVVICPAFAQRLF